MATEHILYCFGVSEIQKMEYGGIAFALVIAAFLWKILGFSLNPSSSIKKTTSAKEARRTKGGVTTCVHRPPSTTNLSTAASRQSPPPPPPRKKIGKTTRSAAAGPGVTAADLGPASSQDAANITAAVAEGGSSLSLTTEVLPAPSQSASSLTTDEKTVPSADDDDAAAPPEPVSAATAAGAAPELTPSMARRQRRKRMKQRAAEAPPPATAPTPPPAEQQLDLPAEVVYQLLRRYMLPAEQLHMIGFPHSSSFHRGKAYIYKGLAGSPRPARKIKLDAAAKEFVPRALASSSDCDSGTHSSETGDDSSGSSGSEPPDEQQVPDDVSEPDSVHSSASESDRGERPLLRPLCVRCTKPFAVTPDGYYTDTTERCVFHWGKLKSGSSRHGAPSFACCGGRPGGRGCSTAACHVWSGLLPGLNGPLKGFVRSRRRRSPPADGNHGVYALDCEMCYTGQGLELARISVVGLNGKRVYDALVRPERAVVDYNTRFSGITARQLDRATKTLRAVQSDLMGFISADTVLIGHGLENDLRALRLVHDSVVDTSVLFPHYLGLPYRRRLSHLTASCLGWSIQQDSAGRGHDSLEDARACMQLVLFRARRDLRLD